MAAVAGNGLALHRRVAAKRSRRVEAFCDRGTGAIFFCAYRLTISRAGAEFPGNLPHTEVPMKPPGFSAAMIVA
jgi:hypothetical protein